MSTPARIAHQTTGRIRIELPSRRGDAAFFTALADELAKSAQVAHARANPAAASLVVEYSGPPEALLAQLERCAVQLASPGADSAPAGAASTATFAGLAAFPALAAFKPPGGWPRNPMALAGAVFGAVGVVQAVRGEIMLPALSAFWYAASALRLARLPENGRSAEQAATRSNSILP